MKGVDGYTVFHRKYWPVVRRLPNPPAWMIPRLKALGYPPGHVWAACHKYLDGLRARWRL
ncbi:MAG TPA: hypothetical protein GXX28_07350 [Firmicutes bacterium]|nr:hypothetical protein [Bacillota bacterium]